MNEHQLKNNREKYGHPLLTVEQIKDIWESESLSKQPIMQLTEYLPPPFEMPILAKVKDYGYSVCVVLKISPGDEQQGSVYQEYLECAKEHKNTKDHFESMDFYVLPDRLISMFYSSDFEGVADYIANAGDDEMQPFYSDSIEQWCFVE